MISQIMKSKYLCALALVILLLFNGAAMGQTFEKSLDVSRTFPAKAMTSIQVENKYGNINIIPWEKDSVKFEIRLEVTSSSMDRLDKVFKSIDFDFTANEYFIIAKTVFKNQKSRFLSEITDMASSLFNSSNAQIDYVIYLPGTTDLTVDNKFGDLYTTNLEGKIKLSVSNGNIRAHSLTGDVRINLEFGDLTLHELDIAAMEINYANINIDNLTELNLTSRSSDILIDNAGSMDIQSRRDKFVVKNLGRITGDASFSNLELKIIADEMIMNSEYGGININQVATSFSRIDLSSNYTDIEILVSNTNDFDFQLIHTQESDVSISGFVEITETEILNKDEGVVKITGFQGDSSPHHSRISVDLKSGSFKIM